MHFNHVQEMDLLYDVRAAQGGKVSPCSACEFVYVCVCVFVTKDWNWGSDVVGDGVGGGGMGSGGGRAHERQQPSKREEVFIKN